MDQNLFWAFWQQFLPKRAILGMISKVPAILPGGNEISIPENLLMQSFTDPWGCPMDHAGSCSIIFRYYSAFKCNFELNPHGFEI